MNLKKPVHIFLANRTCRFVVNVVGSLINNEILDRESIVIATYSGGYGFGNVKQEAGLIGVSVCDWEELKTLDKKQILSINSMSLLSANAKILNELLNIRLVEPKNTNIIITDDELDRWHQLSVKYGKLICSEIHHVDQNVIDVLEKDINFICPGSLIDFLEIVLQRIPRYTDVNINFPILRESELSVIEELFLKQRNGKQEAKKIMINTKPNVLTNKYFAWVLFKYFIFYYKGNRDKEITLGLWMTIKNKNLILFQASLFLIKLIKRVNINIEFLRLMSAKKYLVTLYDYDSLLLQGRGGGSTAKYFVSKIGQAVLPANTINENGLRIDYGININSYKNIYEGLDLVLSDFDSDSLKVNNEKIKNRNEHSIRVLKKLWSVE